MNRLAQNTSAALAAVIIMLCTFVPVVTVPSVNAATAEAPLIA